MNFKILKIILMGYLNPIRTEPERILKKTRMRLKSLTLKTQNPNRSEPEWVPERPLLRASPTINTILVSKSHYFIAISTLKTSFSPTITLNFTPKLFYNIICIKFLIYHLFNCMFH